MQIVFLSSLLQFFKTALRVLVILPAMSYAGQHVLTTEQTLSLARKGNTEAQVQLGIAYEHGEGIDKDANKAVYWYCRAAKKGSVEAQSNLAWMYANGRGVERNEAIAVRWFKKAAKAGDAYSKQMLSRLDSKATTTRTVCGKQPSPYWQSKQCGSSCQQIVSLVEKTAPHYGLESRLVLAVIQQESGFKTHARSVKGAQGLMQLMPTTAKRFGIENITDTHQNLKGGMLYLRWLLNQFDGNLAHALAGYNAGENAVKKYQGIPPYPETRKYVKSIMSLYASNDRLPAPQQKYHN